MSSAGSGLSSALVRATLLSLVTSAASLGAQQTYTPRIEDASSAGQDAIAGFAPADGLEVTLVAAEPMLANPVAFDVAPDGRIYVVETFRLRNGVIDMRNHAAWVLEDLAARTVADRVANVRRHFADDLAAWTREQERVRCLIDDDGDGRTDRSTVFADGFAELADGIAAGVLAHGDRVFFTDIPHLWELTDADRDGIAEARRALHDGFGVHFSLIGHDLHGLRIGPDQRLYFSIGDRGFHVETPDGRTLDHPNEGAVLRCELDGSALEVVHRGLRNPQELAFDDAGDLFTGDNNSDGGDQARWVHVIEGADSGWRIGFQWLRDRGAWNRESMWKPRQDGQPLYVLPPVANVANGPSGLTADPGTGFDPRYRGAFFLCDFRGTPTHSGVLALRTARRGASHELVGTEQVLWKVLLTDVEFGPDGALYALDWVRGWGCTGRGRVYRVAPPSLATDAAAQQTRVLLGAGMGGRDAAELASLLGNPDRRVRLAAQFELADRGDLATLAALARGDGETRARLHAVWGLGTLARHGRTEAVAALRPLLDDRDPELRAQTLRALGDVRDAEVRERAVELLADAEPRVAFFAAQALGRIGGAELVEPLCELLRRNDDADLALRQAAITALERLGDARALRARMGDPSRAVRAGVLVVLRRLGDPMVARFLSDVDPSLRTEAARAIHDVPIREALPALASALLTTTSTEPAFVLRALGARRLLGRNEDLRAVCAFAANRDVAEELRREALEIVAEWTAPRPQDRVHGNAIDLPAQRSRLAFDGIWRRALSVLLSACNGDLGRRVCEITEGTQVPEAPGLLRNLVLDRQRDATVRAAALRAFGRLATPAERGTLARAVGPEDPVELRRRAVAELAELDPPAAVPNLASLVRDGEPADARNAVDTLAELRGDDADRALATLVDDLDALRDAVRLDVVEAARAARGAAVAAALARLDAARAASGDALAAWRDARVGGDRARGERLFREHVTAQCTRCHAYRGSGGSTGPALDSVGTRHDRDGLLVALLDPGRAIAAGYEQVVLTLDDGSTVAGTSRGVRGDAEVLVDADGNETLVPSARIRKRETSGSAMPPMGELLQPREVRDLIEFLSAARDS
ncbi:MAG: HEAT repeat domain-containing protein [Planctomycetes bacterium]|nr:HEAT repeat domain-containing protein [Planctomycetota bacterium]